jgi:hypothetical protein
VELVKITPSASDQSPSIAMDNRPGWAGLSETRSAGRTAATHNQEPRCTRSRDHAGGRIVKWQRSIKHKLVLLVMVTTGVALLTASLAFSLYDFVSYRRILQSELTALADVLGANSTAALAFRDRPAAEEVLQALTADQRVYEACIYDRSGRPFARFGPAGGRPPAMPARARPTGIRVENGWIQVSRPIRLVDDPLGTISV